jgi:hypothetical protein
MTSSYESELDRVVEEWQKETISDEWLFAQFRESYISTMEPNQAFDALNATIEHLLDVHDEGTFIELAQTVVDLAKRSETTEIPSLLTKNKTELERKIQSYGNYAKDKIAELFHHYRLIK